MSPRVQLWLADLDALSSSFERLSEEHLLLCEEETIEFIDSEKIPRLRMRRTARMALRFVLSCFFGPMFALRKFETGPFGKPAIPGLSGDFNLAHAGGFALIGVGSVPSIGVDLEPVREVRLSPLRRSALIAAALEVSHGFPLPEQEDLRTVQAWTRLEALAKAEGQGIGRILSRYGIWRASRDFEVSSNCTDTTLLVHDLPVDHVNMLASVCLPIGIAPPRVSILSHHFDELLTILRTKFDPLFKSDVDLPLVARQNNLQRSVAQPG